jgi:hypothetical protein
MMTFLKNEKIQLGLILALALGVRLVGLTQYPLNGDEYGSIAEAARLGLNWQSLAYAGLLRLWMVPGESDAWLRVLSLFFSLGTVGCVFACARLMAGQPAAVISGLLAAFSPFLFYHAQEVRFYAFFIFSSALFLYLALRWDRAGRPRRGLVGLFLSGLLLIFSHFLGTLVLLAQLLLLWTASRPYPARASLRRTGWACLGLGMAFLLPLLPAVQRILWQIYQQAANVTSTPAPVTTAVSAVSLAKIGVAGYVFLFGYHVYPLQLWLVIPGLLLFAGLLMNGSILLVRQGRYAALPFLYGVLLAGVYLALDSAGGRLAGGVAPRHAAFMAPVLLLLLGIGCAGLPGRWPWLALAGLLVIELAALGLRWQGNWSYGDLLDYRLAARFAQSNLAAGDLLLHDGRSQGAIERYFPSKQPRLATWQVTPEDLSESLEAYDRLQFISNDYQAERRAGFDDLLQALSQDFDLVNGRVEYPLFQYTFARKAPAASGYPVDPETGQVSQPLSIYGLEFSDLELPLQVEAAGVQLEVSGAFALSGGEQASSLVLPLEQPVRTGRLVLLTSLLDPSHTPAGEQVAEVRLRTADGRVIRFPLRVGMETQPWQETCAENSACRTVFQWNKRLALLGQRAYPQAWQDFMAGMHAVSLELPETLEIEQIEFQAAGTDSALVVWAAALPPG